MSKAIQYFDKAYYNHIGVAWIPEKTDRILTLDMWSQGLDCVPLSRRMAGYKDFCILRPNVELIKIDAAISTVLEYWDGTPIKYDYTLLLRIALIKKTGIDITGLGKKKSYICSEFAQYYSSLLGFNLYSALDLITPQDFLRFYDESCFKILLDDGNFTVKS